MQVKHVPYTKPSCLPIRDSKPLVVAEVANRGVSLPVIMGNQVTRRFLPLDDTAQPLLGAADSGVKSASWER